MSKKHSPGCNCCSCQDQCIGGTDFFDTVRDGYQTYTTTTAVFATHGSCVNLDSSAYTGSYYRNISTEKPPDDPTVNLRVGVSAVCKLQAAGNITDYGTLTGVFIGGVARLYVALVGVQWKVYLDSCNAFGYGIGDTPIELGVIFDASQGMGITIAQDPQIPNHYFLRLFFDGFFSGNDYGYGWYATVGTSVNVGVIGVGTTSWDNLCLTVNHNNLTKCFNCGGTPAAPATPTRAWDLSVGSMTNDSCACDSLSGDYVLKYQQYLGVGSYFGCVWVTDDEITDPCGFQPGWVQRKWVIRDNGGTLTATTGVNVLKYSLSSAWNPTGANTYTYNCAVGCAGACLTYPSTLTITPHV